MKNLILKTFLPVLVIAACLAGAYAVIASAPEVKPEPVARNLPGVRVVTVASETVNLPIIVHGTVEPRTEVTIAPQVSGKVTFVAPSLREGGFIEKDEVLIRIDRRDYELAEVKAAAEVAQAQARLDREEAEARVAAKEWERYGKGTPSDLVLRKPQLAEAAAMVASAEARLAEAGLALDRTEIFAPLDGRVRSENVDEGQHLNAGAPIAHVYSTEFAEVRLAVPDDLLAFIDLPLGESVESEDEEDLTPVTVRAQFGGRDFEWTGHIVRTGAEVDSRSRVVHVLVRVKKPYQARAEGQPPLMVGMYVTAEITGREIEAAVMLPRAALRGGDRVIVVDAEDRARTRTVTVARKGAEVVLVTAGLANGDRVCVSPLEPVVEGMKVRVEEGE